jgi:hypothetical protein
VERLVLPKRIDTWFSNISRPDLSCGRLRLLRETAQGSDKRRAENSTNRPVERMFSSVRPLS